MKVYQFTIDEAAQLNQIYPKNMEPYAKSLILALQKEFPDREISYGHFDYSQLRAPGVCLAPVETEKIIYFVRGWLAAKLD